MDSAVLAARRPSALVTKPTPATPTASKAMKPSPLTTPSPRATPGQHHASATPACSPPTTCGAPPGASFIITRTGSGDHKLLSGEGPLTAVAPKTWCELTFDGVTWRLSRPVDLQARISHIGRDRGDTRARNSVCPGATLSTTEAHGADNIICDTPTKAVPAATELSSTQSRSPRPRR